MSTEAFLNEQGAQVEHSEDQVFPRIAGALIGAAAADALGWITEFVRGHEHLRKLYKTDFVNEYRPWQKTSGGRFNAYIDYINKGEYSDDTQLSLAVARSVLADGAVDVEHFSKIELPLWLDYARGAGSTITAAAKAIQRKSASWNKNFFMYRHRGRQLSYRDTGANGAAMRAGPMALANIHDPESLELAVWRTSIVTHGHPRAILGALVYAEALRRCAETGSNLQTSELIGGLKDYTEARSIPQDPALQEWTGLWNEGTKSVNFADAWREVQVEVLSGLDMVAASNPSVDVSEPMRVLGCFDPSTKGSATATVLAGLLIFHCVGDNARKAVLTAVNQLGSDTDTIGGFVGALCGARWGYDSVPQEWASELQDYEYFMRTATELSRVAVRTGIGGQALLPEPRGEAARLPNLLTLLSTHEISAQERVYHPLFGPGWVESVDAQRLRRKDGAEVVFARTRFDIGQSCKFRFMTIPKSKRRPQRPTSEADSSQRRFFEQP